MLGFKPEPIAIPKGPAIEIPLGTAASDDIARAHEAGGGPSGLAPENVAPGGEGAQQQRSHEFEQLSAALNNSEIQPDTLSVLKIVGHGSSGVVQKVLHVPSDSVLALKVIPLAASEEARRAILIELRALHESRHEAIVAFYGAFYRDGAVHIALEYMDGSLLDVMRATAAALPEPLVGAIACPVLSGLAYLHRERHVVHRDIKPSNLLVDGCGNVKIADFGVSGELGTTLSKCASWVGTMHYMSPERISGGSYSYDSDVWSLGITLLELATGAFPYSSSGPSGARISYWDLLECIVEGPSPTPPDHCAPLFHGLITSCLHKQPEVRAERDGHPAAREITPPPREIEGDLIRIARTGPRVIDSAPIAPIRDRALGGVGRCRWADVRTVGRGARVATRGACACGAARRRRLGARLRRRLVRAEICRDGPRSRRDPPAGSHHLATLGRARCGWAGHAARPRRVASRGTR